METYKNFLRHRLITPFTVLSITLIALLTYSYILGYFFTTPDALTLIETSRIQSVNDLTKIFTEPLMSKTKFLGLAKYYRPISTLSFSLDYFIWRLNPFGYHLTDLIVHTLVSIFVFFLIRSLTNGKQLQAWLAAVIFATHPILAEVVPGIARRQDTIATLFMILSLLFFLKHLRSISHKKLLLFFSIFFYTSALGSKEIAVILVPLIFAYLMIFSFDKSFKNRLIQAIKKCLPYFLLTFMFLLWRTHILKGIGGHHALLFNSLGIFKVAQSLFKVITIYFIDLLYPVDFLIFNVSFNILKHTSISLIAIFSLFIILLFYSRTIFKTANHNSKGTIKIFKTLLITLVILSLAGMLASPLISPFINQFIHKANLGEKLKLLTKAMEVRYSLPLEFGREDFILRLLFFTLASISTLCLIITHQRGDIRSFFINSPHGKLIGFLLIWLFLPLCVYLPTLTFTHPNIYNSVIPFSAFLAVIFIENLQFVIQKIRKKEFINPPKILGLIIITSLLISSITYSPLVRRYKDWEAASNLYVMFLDKLSGIVPELPNNTIIYIYNLPQVIFSSKAGIPRVQTATYLTDYSIKSWLDLNYPNNTIEIVAINRGGVYTNISELQIEMVENKRVVNINVLGKRIK